MTLFKKLSQAGDTIAEVMICLAILSFVLSSAYVVTNRNQLTTQAAHERSEALKLADSQLELLRAYTDTHSLPTNDYFCLQANGGNITVVPMASNPQSPSPTYPAACVAGPDGRYSFVVWNPSRATAIGGNGSSFAATARWGGLNTVAEEEVHIFYSVFDTNSAAYGTPSTAYTPATECRDGPDNSDPEDSLADESDAACHTDGNPGNIASYNALIASEVNPRCNNFSDDDGDGRVDTNDAGCHTDGNRLNAASFNRIDNDETNAICSNDADDDGDGKVDYPADPGCSSYIDSTECDPPAQLTVSTGSLSFESWHLYNTGGVRPSLSFTVRNPSNCASISLGSTPITGANTNSFTITSNGCANTTLVASATCNITVRFYPPSGGGNHRLGNAGNKTAAVTINNNNSIPSPPSVSLAGKAFAEVLGPNDVLSDSTTPYLRVYNNSCYKNVEACGSPYTGIGGDGNLWLGGTYCLWGGWGPGGYGNYTGGNVLIMQGDGNLVFYDPYIYRYASWTYGGNYWLRLQPDGGVNITNGQYGPIVKWIHSGGTCFAW